MTLVFIISLIYFNAKLISYNKFFQILAFFFCFLFKYMIQIGLLYVNLLKCINNFPFLFSWFFFFSYFDFFWQIYLHAIIVFALFSVPIFLILYFFNYLIFVKIVSSIHIKLLMLSLLYLCNSFFVPFILATDLITHK